MRRLAVLIALSVFPLKSELLPIRSYTAADGLAADAINQIVVDSRGFVWFCTTEGLSRYDGYRLISFGTAEGLPHGTVDTFLETRSGAYFAGTSRGLCQFHAGGGGNRITTYRLGKGGRNENYVEALLESSTGGIWCGTGGGLFEAPRDFQFQRRLLPGLRQPEVTEILEDSGGKLWVATTSGIYIFGKHGAIESITKADGLPHPYVGRLLQDRSGRIWAGTRGGLVLMRGGDAGSGRRVQQVYTDHGEILHNDVTALAEGSDGTIWIGAAEGISRLVPGNGRAEFRNLTRANGLIDRRVLALAADKAGNIWAGTEGAGAMKIQPAGFTTFREDDGLPSDRVTSVFADRIGTVVAVTNESSSRRHSVCIFDGVKFRAVAPKVFGNNGPWGMQQILLQSRTREWWAATREGLCQFGPSSAEGLAGKQPRACYARDLDVFRVFEDSKGGIWASAQYPDGSRLLRWDPGNKAITWFEDGPNHNELISAFAEDRHGGIWMGLWGGGALFRYDGRQFRRFKQSDGAPAGAIHALLTDSAGRLWIGSHDGGLVLVENPGGERFRVRTYDTATGLASNLIQCLVEDNAGRIYAGTGRGVDRLNPATGRIKHFSSADGLAHGKLTTALRDGSGNLWFATKQGLSRLTPIADQPPAVPSVLITDLRIGGVSYPMSQRGETLIRQLELEPSRNQLQVEFAGFNDEPGESLRYSYKLEGGSWSPPLHERTVNYAALSAGSYRFLVKAVNSEGMESTAPAEIDFQVLPPFWRRWWFEGLALSALVAIVYFMHRYRVAQMIAIERMRMAIATDLHDDIGASLSQIAVLSEVARAGGSSGEPLQKVAALARELVDSMSDVVWSIRSEPAGIDSLVRRMREFSYDLLVSQAIGFELRTSAGAARVELSLQARRQIFLIYKECIHNAARHSHCSRVVTELTVEDREILLSVTDDGVGLNGSDPVRRVNRGAGLPSMRQRAESLGGDIRFLSDHGQGCTVTVRLPLRRSAFSKAAV
jgi:ligand-binding sensor domain-containing protein/signal transduction histidine kinase